MYHLISRTFNVRISHTPSIAGPLITANIFHPFIDMICSSIDMDGLAYLHILNSTRHYKIIGFTQFIKIRGKGYPPLISAKGWNQFCNLFL